MPLQPVDARPWIDGQGVRFLMRSDSGEVRCYLHQGALDMIEQPTARNMQEQIDRFERHRATFEAIASDLHDVGLLLRITADHVTKLRRR
jgi:hypothetical protein